MKIEVEAFVVVDKNGIAQTAYRRKHDAQIAADFGNEHAPSFAPWRVIRCVGEAEVA